MTEQISKEEIAEITEELPKETVKTSSFTRTFIVSPTEKLTVNFILEHKREANPMFTILDIVKLCDFVKNVILSSKA